ncbi:RNA polymerase II transcription factor SIII subunit A-domain-containing protein [Hypoxylon sp. FL1150]|nr:RNA polymerase II transcription factor SIII subunit A-domain-containing protein [Hypoxylon sp. FL1150]
MVKSLVELCTAVCVRNVRDIHDVGGAPYKILRPILMRVDTAEQLRELEERSPHILGDDAECWIRLIQRDFPIDYRKTQLQPSNPESWHKVYAKYEKLDADRKRTAAEKLSSAYKKIEQEKQSNVTTITNFSKKVFGKPPGKRSGGRAEATGSGGLKWGGGSRTKTSSGQSIMRKVRREAGEVARRNMLSTPTGQLPVRQGQIIKAPLGMRVAYETKALPAVQRMAPREQSQSNIQQEKFAKRLLQIKNGYSAQKPTVISDDELDTSSSEEQGTGGLDADDLESLYDAKKKPAAPTATSKTNKPSAMSPSNSLTSRPIKSASLNPLAKMKQGHAWRDKPVTLAPVNPPTPKASAAASRPSAGPSGQPKQSSPPAPATSPSTAASTSSGPEHPKPRPRPMIGQKRKEPPSIFMKPKPKTRRMS